MTLHGVDHIRGYSAQLFIRRLAYYTSAFLTTTLSLLHLPYLISMGTYHLKPSRRNVHHTSNTASDQKFDLPAAVAAAVTMEQDIAFMVCTERGKRSQFRFLKARLTIRRQHVPQRNESRAIAYLADLNGWMDRSGLPSIERFHLERYLFRLDNGELRFHIEAQSLTLVVRVNWQLSLMIPGMELR